MKCAHAFERPVPPFMATCLLAVPTTWTSGRRAGLCYTSRFSGSDTFGPLGPSIAVGLDYANCRLQLRHNGEVKQSQMVSDLIFPPSQVVSFVSQYVTLTPGDVIYTGTPGKTSPMKPGDTVEVEIDGIGILKNTVAEG